MNFGSIDMEIILKDFENIKRYKDYVSATASKVGKIREELKLFMGKSKTELLEMLKDVGKLGEKETISS